MRNDVIQINPRTLRVHPKNRQMPRLEAAVAGWQGLVEDVAAHGVLEPILITQSHEVVDGWTRRQAAIAAGRELVPARMIEAEEVNGCLLRALAIRKHLTKGQVAYDAVFLLADTLSERSGARLRNLRKPQCSPEHDSIVIGEKRVDEFAEELGISHDTLQQARTLHAIFSGDAKVLRDRNLTGVDPAKLREEWEPRIRSLVDPPGLGAVLAGIAGARATRDLPKTPNADTQLELFGSGLEMLSRVAKAWPRLGTNRRPEIVATLRTTAAGWPTDLRRELAEALLAGIEEKS